MKQTAESDLQQHNYKGATQVVPYNITRTGDTKMNNINIERIKNRIYKLDSMTEKDRDVIHILNSFWACSDAYIKANLACRLVPYAGCEAWKITMNAVYKYTI